MKTQMLNLRSLTQKVLKGDTGAERQLRALLTGKPGVVEVPSEKVLHGPLQVTPYGATSPAENFAEAFAHYVLGKPLVAELAAIMGNLR